MRQVETVPDVIGHVLMGEQARHQAVDLDAVGAPFDGEGFDHVLHAGLGGGRVGEAGATRPGVGGPHVDDRGRTAGGEVAAGELPADQEGAVERDVDNRPPGVGRQVLGGRREVGGGVVDEHPGQAEALLGGVEGGGDCIGIADVALDDLDVGAEGLASRPAGCEELRVAAGDHDRCPQTGEFDGDGLAEAGAGAGDEHRVVVVGSDRQGAGARGWRGG